MKVTEQKKKEAAQRRREFDIQRREEEAAASKVQALQRGKMARREVSKRKLEAQEAHDEASDSEDSEAEELEDAKAAAQAALQAALFGGEAPAEAPVEAAPAEASAEAPPEGPLEAAASPTSAAPGKEAPTSAGADSDVPVSPAAGAAGDGQSPAAVVDDVEKPSPGTVLRVNGELKEENHALRTELGSLLKSEPCSPAITEEQVSPERDVPVAQLLPAHIQAQVGSPTMAQAGLFLPGPQAPNSASPLSGGSTTSGSPNNQQAKT